MKTKFLNRLTGPFLLLVFLLAVAASAIASDAPRVPRSTLATTEKKLDDSFNKLWNDNPFVVLGPTRGVYLEGYGAVFTAEINLVAGPPIGIMMPPPDKQDIARHKQQKIARIPELKKALEKMLVVTASSPEMAAVPPDQQIVIVGFLSHFPWEDLSGLPIQIMVQGSKGKLLDAQRQGTAALEAAIQAVQF